MIGAPCQEDPRICVFDGATRTRVGPDPRYLFSEDVTASMPVIRKRDDPQFRVLRRLEYAYIAHRWPLEWSGSMYSASMCKLTEADTLALVETLADHFDIYDWRVQFRGPTFRAWSWPARNIMHLPATGPRLNVCVVLHEFAHWLAGPDTKSGHSGYSWGQPHTRYDYRSQRRVHVSGKRNPDKSWHGPSFIRALIEIYKVAGGLTDAY